MTYFSRTLIVQKPYTEAFEYVADFTNREQWDPNVTSAEKRTEGAPKAGSTFTLCYQTSISSTPIDVAMDTFEQNKSIQTSGNSPAFNLTEGFFFRSIADDTTEIRIECHVTTSNNSSNLYSRLAAIPFAKFNAAANGLERALNDQPEPVTPANYLADRLVLPGMLNFTKRGYLKAQKHWKGLINNMHGKKVVITGATSGLGKATAFALNRMGADLLIVARNPQKASELSEQLFLESGRRPLEIIANLESIAETLEAAKEIQQKLDHIDVLVNNAGALFNERAVTQEGLERSFALLLLSPFALTETLMPQLLASNGARVINVSSGGMYTQPIHLSDLNYEKGKYDGPQAYARAKRGLVDMSEWWSRQANLAPVTFNAMHPGWADTAGVEEALPGFHKVTKPFLRSAKEGADTIVWLAAAKEAADQNGKFWLDRQPHTTVIFPKTGSTQAKQDKLQVKLQALLEPFKEANLSSEVNQAGVASH